MPWSHLGGVIPRQQVVDLTLFVAVDDGLEGCGQIDMWLDGVEFAGFNQGRDVCPVCGTRIVAREESVLSVQRDGSDCSLDGIVVYLNPTVGDEQAKAGPVFCNIFQRLAQGRLCGCVGVVVSEPSLEGGNLWRLLILADGQAGVGRHALDRGFDFVEFSDALQPVFGDWRGVIGHVAVSFRSGAHVMRPCV